MANRPIRSEQIEAQYRRLLPAQAGNEVSTDLLASDTIIPVVNITGAAEGQALREDLQTAVDGANTGAAFVGAGFYDWATTPGFYRLSGVMQIDASVAANEVFLFIFKNGPPSTPIFGTGPAIGGGTSVLEFITIPPMTVFLQPGETIRSNNTGARTSILLNITQIADLYGNLSTPLGFTFQ